MKRTDLFDKLDNVIGNYVEGSASEKDVVDTAYKLNKYLLEHPHPHDLVRDNVDSDVIDRQPNMKWINVNDELPNDGEFVFTYRPMAKESGDEIYTAQKFIGKGFKNKSPQGVEHGFDRWCHPTHWMRIEQPLD